MSISGDMVASDDGRPPLTGGMTFLFALACGASVANLYYAQPLVALIADSTGLSRDAAGLTVTLSQLGYAAGLILLVPLGDLLENRRLITVTLLSSTVALLCVALATNGPALLAAATLLGITTVVTQMLVPFASHLAPEAVRGRVVGNVMSGLLAGILLARPVSGFVADLFGWRIVFGAAACLTLCLAVLLARGLPRRAPTSTLGYRSTIGSMPSILASTPLLRRRMAYQAALFGAFSLFWTAVPLELAGPPFGLSQSGIALFALAGAAGALVAPLAGRLADAGHSRTATGCGLLLGIAAFALAWLGQNSLPTLAAAAILLDSGAQLSLVVGQRAIFALHPGLRSRLNGLYMAGFFTAGALGSALASPVYGRLGWPGVAALGAAFPLAALVFFATEFRARAQGDAA